MGTSQSIQQRYIVTGSIIALTTVVCIGIYTRKKHIRQMTSSKKPLINLEPISPFNIQYRKESVYTSKVEEIQRIMTQLKTLIKNNADQSDIIECKKAFIEKTHWLSINMIIKEYLQIFEKFKRDRRLKIDRYDQYVKEVVSQNQKLELIFYDSKKEVLKDIGISQAEYNLKYQSLFEFIPNFFMELGVKAERYKMAKVPARSKGVVSVDRAKDYYSQKITVFDEVLQKGLFKDVKLNGGIDQLRVIIEFYVNDKVALYSDIENEDISKRKDFFQNPQIYSVHAKYMAKFFELSPAKAYK